MIYRSHDLSVAGQASELGINRGGAYYLPRPVSAADLVLMRRIDELHLEYPAAGSRIALSPGWGGQRRRPPACRNADEADGDRGDLPQAEHLEASAQRSYGHKIYPYLLCKLPVTRPNQVWAMDITYIPMARFGMPDIFNTDQDSQFTSVTFTTVLSDNGIKIRMDGKGVWRDNVFVERLWKSVKYEEVYLRAYETFSHARASIGRYLDFYNGRRPHSSLGRKTPDHAYFTQPLLAEA